MTEWRSRIVDHANVAPADLEPNEANWRTHPPAQREALAEVMDRVGWVQDIVVNRRSGRLIDGHLRLDLALERAEPTVPVVYVDLDEDEERLMLASLDPLSAMAETSGADLTALLDGLALGNGSALSTLLADLEDREDEEPKAPKVPYDPDDVPDVAEEPWVQRGELWQLGEHMLLCDDSMEPEAVDRLLDGIHMDLVLTDPPYAIYGSASGLSSSVTDDKIVRPFFRDVLRLSERSAKMFAHVYVFCDWRSWPAWWESARSGRLEPKNLLVWDKGGAGLGNNYANTYELIGFFARMPEQKTMAGDRPTGQRPVLRSNIIRADRPRGEERLHNAAKPVGLLEELIGNSTEAGDAVLDPFVGSGSTLMACERTGRRCFALEIEPKWAQVTIERWQRATGLQAVRL